MTLHTDRPRLPVHVIASTTGQYHTPLFFFAYIFDFHFNSRCLLLFISCLLRCGIASAFYPPSHPHSVIMTILDRSSNMDFRPKPPFASINNASPSFALPFHRSSYGVHRLVLSMTITGPTAKASTPDASLLARVRRLPTVHSRFDNRSALSSRASFSSGRCLGSGRGSTNGSGWNAA